MAIVKSYDKKTKYSHYSDLFRNPFWMFLLGICVIFFIAANSVAMYIMSTCLLVLSLSILAYAYFGEELNLHNRIFRHLSKLDEGFIILPSMKITDGYEHGCTSFVVISPKGVFNIKVLDFTGILEGQEKDGVWNYTDYSFPYQPQHRRIRNPIFKLEKSQKILESLLKKNHINYLFLKSIFIVKNQHAVVKCDTDIPIIKLNELNDYILGCSDRQHTPSFLESITAAIMSGHSGSCCEKFICAE
ncbi:nuclease-related domain-containing protein [Alkaliphilus peptidifermentans]|uniref:Nuclease-related domain-containing protein n=1 Tax=Alkaliphilus peptidifermentans DSM 18978 TaxID=1120976 RepID=A0A1G5ADG9_9FIRM|nr:nuclease-related domain-containing protein [Alkaliphilus peptidifermentans]SCX75901.1 Nuclease-related domain-containing protein [Alkaliphilus peptidifermentans DSM 18978]